MEQSYEFNDFIPSSLSAEDFYFIVLELTHLLEQSSPLNEPPHEDSERFELSLLIIGLSLMGYFLVLLARSSVTTHISTRYFNNFYSPTDFSAGRNLVGLSFKSIEHKDYFCTPKYLVLDGFLYEYQLLSEFFSRFLYSHILSYSTRMVWTSP